MARLPSIYGTTILAVRQGGHAAIAGDGRRIPTEHLETVLEHLSFEVGEGVQRAVRIDAEEARRRLAPISTDQDLRRYIP